MHFFTALLVTVILLLNPLLCSSASSSNSSTSKGKPKAKGYHGSSSHALEKAKKDKAKAEREMKFHLSNVDDALDEDVSMGHPGYNDWIHLAGERKKKEANAKAHHIASKIILKNHAPHRETFEYRAEKLDHSAGHIQRRMDEVKAKDVYDFGLHNARLDEHHQRMRDHDDAITGLDEAIRKHSHPKSRKKLLVLYLEV